MGMPWVRLDTAWPQNPKFLMLIQDKKWRAITVYMAGLAYCGAQGSDGFLPYYALQILHGTRREVAELCKVALWIPCEGGWQVNDWLDYQFSSEQHAIRTEKARKAALVRWHGSLNGHAPSMPNAMQ